MLRQILRELEMVRGAVDINYLSSKLGIERSALDGMIDYLVRKGRLQDDDQGSATTLSCISHGCVLSCGGSQACPFIDCEFAKDLLPRLS